jgi:C1A family cysteine protease
MAAPKVPAAARSLPRRDQKWFGWKPQLPDHRDRLYAPTLGAQPPSASLTPEYLPPTRNQGNQGSCTGHSCRSIGQFIRMSEGQRNSELSPRFIYFNGRVIEGTQNEDSGCEIRDVVKAVAKLGFASEHDCPYQPSNWTRKPSPTAYKDAQRDVAIQYQAVPLQLPTMKQTILDQHGFILGFSVYSSFDDIGGDGLMPMASGSLEGGHAVFAVAYDDNKDIKGQRGGFCIQNSWDTDWGTKGPNGEGGYFWMPYRYITNPNLCADFWTILKVS